MVALERGGTTQKAEPIGGKLPMEHPGLGNQEIVDAVDQGACALAVGRTDGRGYRILDEALDDCMEAAGVAGRRLRYYLLALNFCGTSVFKEGRAELLP